MNPQVTAQGIEFVVTLTDSSMWNWAAGAILTVNVVDWAWHVFMGGE